MKFSASKPWPAPSAGYRVDCIAVDGAFPQHLILATSIKSVSAFPMSSLISTTPCCRAPELLNLGSVDLALSPFPTRQGLNEEICMLSFTAVAHRITPVCT